MMTTRKAYDQQKDKAGDEQPLAISESLTTYVEGDWLHIEARSWRSVAKRVDAVLEQAEMSAKPGQLPVVVIHA